MDWITATIAIGDYCEAQDEDLLRREGLGSVLGLTSTLQGKKAGDLGLERIEIVPLRDGPGNHFEDFLRALSTLGQLLAEAPPILVHCRAGWHRSPVVVAGHLMQTRGLSADEAWSVVAARRQVTLLADLRELLTRLEKDLAASHDQGVGPAPA
jgi:hypothetical protein